MQNFTTESADSVSPQGSSGRYPVIGTDSTGSADPDEFVLDLTSPCGSDYLFNTSSFSNEKSLQARFNDSGTYVDTVPKGTKRMFDIGDIPELGSDETRSSGYESDNELGEQDIQLNRKKMKISHSKYKAQQSPSNIMTYSEKRRYSEEDSSQHRKKRLKTSLPGVYERLNFSDSKSSSNSYSSSSWSSVSSDSISHSSSHSCADSSTSSDSSNSIRDILNLEEPCSYLSSINEVIFSPESCVCKVEQSRRPIPIERRRRSIQSLYKKLLQRRLLSTANTFSHTCCNRQCYLNWVRNRISIGRMVNDYGESDLRVDRFSWGQWKQTPKVDEKSSSDDDWFW